MVVEFLMMLKGVTLVSTTANLYCTFTHTQLTYAPSDLHLNLLILIIHSIIASITMTDCSRPLKSIIHPSHLLCSLCGYLYDMVLSPAFPWTGLLLHLMDGGVILGRLVHGFPLHLHQVNNAQTHRTTEDERQLLRLGLVVEAAL